MSCIYDGGRRGFLTFGNEVQGQVLCDEQGLQPFNMFDESGAMEGRGHNFSTFPSCDFLPDLPELFEKSPLEHQDTILRTSVQPYCESRMPACREMNRVHPNEDETSEVAGGLVLDVADDLEAILGYTDENDDHVGPPPVAVVNESPYELTSKRKRLRKELEDEEEVESKFSKRQKPELSGTCHGLNSPDASTNGTVSVVTQPPCDDPKFEEFYLDQSTDELQMLCDDFAFEMPEQQCSSCTPDGGEDSISSGSARQSRRQKIKATVKLLREAIPGGECMDTAIVLDEAINYVKLLQLQVQALGAQRLAQRAGAGR